MHCTKFPVQLYRIHSKWRWFDCNICAPHDLMSFDEWTVCGLDHLRWLCWSLVIAFTSAHWNFSLKTSKQTHMLCVNVKVLSSECRCDSRARDIMANVCIRTVQIANVWLEIRANTCGEADLCIAKHCFSISLWRVSSREKKKVKRWAHEIELSNFILADHQIGKWRVNRAFGGFIRQQQCLSISRDFPHIGSNPGEIRWIRVSNKTTCILVIISVRVCVLEKKTTQVVCTTGERTLIYPRRVHAIDLYAILTLAFPFFSLSFILPAPCLFYCARANVWECWKTEREGARERANERKMVEWKQVSRFKSFSMCLLQFPRMIDNYIGIIPTFRAAIYSIRGLNWANCALANVIVMLKMCTASRQIGLYIIWLRLIGFDSMQYAQKCSTGGIHLSRGRSTPHWDARESRSEWVIVREWATDSELRRNIHQIYVLRVANETGIGATCYSRCCRCCCFIQHTETCVYCTVKHNEILNQCRLFYLLLFSGRVIVVYSVEVVRARAIPYSHTSSSRSCLLSARSLSRSRSSFAVKPSRNCIASVFFVFVWAIKWVSVRERSRFDGLKSVEEFTMCIWMWIDNIGAISNRTNKNKQQYTANRPFSS